MDCPTTADCIKRLKTHGSKLHSLEVSDGDQKTLLGVPAKKRYKWKSLAASLDELGWREARAKDKAGLVLAIYTLDVDDSEFVDNVQLPEDAAVMLLFAEKVTAMVISGQQTALKAQERQNKSLMDGHASLAKVLTDRLVALERMYAANLRMAQNAVELTGDEDDDSLHGAALKALMPALVQSYIGKQAAAAAEKPNGASKGK